MLLKRLHCSCLYGLRRRLQTYEYFEYTREGESKSLGQWRLVKQAAVLFKGVEEALVYLRPSSQRFILTCAHTARLSPQSATVAQGAP